MAQAGNNLDDHHQKPQPEGSIILLPIILHMQPHNRSTMSPTAFWALAFEQSTHVNPRQGDDREEEAFWQEYAPQYDERSPLARLATDVIADARALLRSNDSLLEIGPGSGAFTRRLAGCVTSIIGVEPSAAMRAEFVRRWPDDDAHPPPQLIAAKWEDCAAPTADIVFSANALYRVTDIATALLKMTGCARRRVILVQTVGRPHANPLVVQAQGNTYERERADALCDVLGELEIKFRDRRYLVDRGDRTACEVALIDWPSAGKSSEFDAD
ncbi:methyltransferase domain-containing protein [Hyphomicrobium sp. D-2]|uniref:class I SAM-dependent methyltransferase n=1 Tax=Hyphomicrobium sp. D-2 TaxID=3041621 RepID=UPI0024589D57|nr:methyltransferase domain-containing protein [Hyphomicrobium sp. D-2]MDH4982132.1 methyltransferase domain-containing protein [Hyphomicrobium sp. D-2]